METLKKVVDHHARDFLSEVYRSKEKYKKIWDYYNQSMPKCINICKNAKGKNLTDDIFGPQGIYWIGSKANILFVGKENYGWTASEKYSENDIQYDPLWFFYHRSAYMSGFWSRIFYAIMKPVLLQTVYHKSQIDDLEWEEIIPHLAVTNLCKCYNYQIQYNLYESCTSSGYITKEIEECKTPIVVLFTGGSYDIIDEISQPYKSRPLAGQKIWKAATKERVYYQMNHPGRESSATIQLLVADIVKEWRSRNL